MNDSDAPRSYLPADVREALAALTGFLDAGANHPSISVHDVTLDQLDATWKFTLVPSGKDGSDNFIKAEKEFGPVAVSVLRVLPAVPAVDRDFPLPDTEEDSPGGALIRRNNAREGDEKPSATGVAGIEYPGFPGGATGST